MELPQVAIQRLKALKEKTEASSYAEVTKNAYRLYDMLIALQESGVSFFMKDSDGNATELRIFV